MHRRKIYGVLLATLVVVVSGSALTQAQFPPPGPIPQPGPLPPGLVPGPYVPITVVVNLDAVKAKVLQDIPPGPVPNPPGPVPVPPPGPVPVQPPPAEGKGPLGKLLQKIKDKKPLQKLLALADQLKIAQELDKIAQPVNLGGDLWLSLNLKEVVLLEVAFAGGFQNMAAHLAVRMEPTIVLSKDRPAPMPLPQLTFGGVPPPPALNGTPMHFVLKLDPRALPQVLPAETQKELDKHGIDITKVTFAQQPGPGPARMIVTAPLQKPLPAELTVSFTPVLKNNVLTFAQPDCALAAPAGKDDNAVQQAVLKLTQDSVRGIVVGKLKSAEIDLGPTLKQLANPPLGKHATPPPSKVLAPIANLRVEGLSAEANHLVVRISGTLAKEGIVVFAP